MVRLFFLLALCCLLQTNTVHAEQYALLVGISDYTHSPGSHLDGPRHDLESLRGLLTGRYGYLPDNITTLVDAQATKGNILAALDSLERTTKEGDAIFFYFSGHGTSASDQKFNAPLPHTSGALVPADFKSSPNDRAEDIVSRLLVGKHDLRPRLSRLEKGRTVLVAFDSCFSGNAVRSFSDGDRPELPTRHFHIDFPERGVGDEPDDLGLKLGKFGAGTKAAEPYPYTNIFFLAAASEHEEARDISEEQLSFYPTYDGKPHGAFTNALLEALAKPDKADTNHDGVLQQDELFKGVKEQVQGNFNHTPHALPATGEDSCNLRGQTFFKAVNGTWSGVGSEDLGRVEKLRVKIDPTLTTLNSRLANMSDLQLVQYHADIAVKRDGAGVALILANGRPLCRYATVDETQLQQRLEQQVTVNRLVLLKYPRQQFNVDVGLLGSSEGVAVADTPLGFTLGSEKEGYPLLINIDTAGTVHVIYPAQPNELEKSGGRGKTVKLPEIGKVVGPFGTEFMKLFYFPERPQNLVAIMGKSIVPGTDDFRLLTELVGLANPATSIAAQDTLRFTTCSPGELQ